jgi:hypothetical protein
LPAQVQAENIVIQELTGRVVYAYTIKNQTDRLALDIEQLSKGMYVVILNSKMGRYTAKLIVE